MLVLLGLPEEAWASKNLGKESPAEVLAAKWLRWFFPCKCVHSFAQIHGVFFLWEYNEFQVVKVGRRVQRQLSFSKIAKSHAWGQCMMSVTGHNQWVWSLAVGDGSKPHGSVLPIFRRAHEGVFTWVPGLAGSWPIPRYWQHIGQWSCKEDTKRIVLSKFRSKKKGLSTSKGHKQAQINNI